jgi:hypothetical protein
VILIYAICDPSLITAILVAIIVNIGITEFSNLQNKFWNLIYFYLFAIVILKSTTNAIFKMDTDTGEVTEMTRFTWKGIDVGQVGHALVEIIVGNTEWNGGL